MKLARKLLEIRILSECVCDGWNKKNLEVNQKILFLIDEYEVCSPSVLISKIGLKKSNLALCCKGLIEQGKIEKFSSSNDKRQVFYKLTQKGKKEVEKIISNIDQMFREAEVGKNELRNFTKVCELLNKKV